MKIRVTPLEYLGLSFRWKFVQLVDKDAKQGFGEFRSSNRKRLLDILIGAFLMVLIVLIIVGFIFFVKYY